MTTTTAQTIVYVSTLLLAIQASDDGKKSVAKAESKSDAIATSNTNAKIDSGVVDQQKTEKRTDIYEPEYEAHEEKLLTIVKKVPVHIPITKHVPYPVEKLVPVPVRVDVFKPYPVYKTVPYPVKEIVKVKKNGRM